METPRVSILTATWEQEHYIGKAIDSVLAQTYKDWEMIIVDDGSTDKTGEVVQERAKHDKRIHYIRINHAGRIATVSNVALKVAKGEYVAVLDGDDEWADPRKLEKQVAFLDDHKEYLACGSAFITMDQDSKETGRFSKPVSDEAIRRVALFANPIANSSTLFRRVPAGLYDETLPQFADWDFWLRLGMQGKLYNSPEYFLSYRMWHKASSFVNQKKNVDAAFVIIRRYRHNYPKYWLAFLGTSAHWTYARLPTWLRSGMNGFMSRFKKRLFAG